MGRLLYDRIPKDKLVWLADPKNAESFFIGLSGIKNYLSEVSNARIALFSSVAKKGLADADPQGRLPIDISRLSPIQLDALRADLGEMASSALEKMNGIGSSSRALKVIIGTLTASKEGREYDVVKELDQGKSFTDTNELVGVSKAVVNHLQFQERYEDILKSQGKGVGK